MPRPLRIEYEGAWYHVMNRGANRQAIFETKKHYEIFLSLLSEISNQFHVEIHAYCLMGNHYHLLIHTPFANLGRAMRHLDGIYTQRFNRSENRDGPLFRGRYKAIIVESEFYLLQLSRYIHLNPIEANLCKNAYDYSWSSLQFYTTKQISLPWLKTNFTLDLISKENSRQRYIEFINQGIDEEISNFYNKQPPALILGSKSFIDKNLEKIKKQNKAEYAPDIKRVKQTSNAETIIETVISYFQIDSKILYAKTPGEINFSKMLAIYFLYHRAHLTHSKIAKYFNLHSASIGATIKRSKEFIEKNNKEFIYHLEKINLVLSK